MTPNHRADATRTIIKVIVADDHAIIRDSFRLIFEKIKGYTLVGEATNGQELVVLAKNLKPDIIITNIRMPVMDGIEATLQITREVPSIGIIAFSMIEESSSITDMIEAGAKGYLLKNAHIEEIIIAIDTVYNGETYYCKETTHQLFKIFGKNDYPSTKSKAHSKCSDKDIEVIKLICGGYSNKEMANRMFLSPRTIEWHRVEILQKLDVKNTAAIVAYAIKNNIC